MSISFFPPSISTCVLWLDASDPTTVTTSGGRLTQWNDKTMFQNSTSLIIGSGPLLSNINGLSSFFFQANSGTAQIVEGPLSSFRDTFSVPTTAYYLTTFAIGTLSTTSVSSYFPRFIQAGVAGRAYAGSEIVQWSTAQANLAVFPTATSNSNYAQIPGFQQPFMVTNVAFQNGLTAFSYLNVNGGFVTRTDGVRGTAASTIGEYVLGGTFSTTTDFRDGWTGQIAEVLLYATTSQLTWEQRQRVEGYLANKWGIQEALPVWHPYKASPIQLTTPTSALYVTNSSQSKSIVLPSSVSAGSQLIWTLPTDQITFNSSVTITARSTELAGPFVSVTLNQQNQSAVLVNQPISSTWIVHSESVNNPRLTCTLPTIPYTQYPAMNNRFLTGGGNLGESVALNSSGTYVASGDSLLTGFISTQVGACFVYSYLPATGRYSSIQGAIYPSDLQNNMNMGNPVAFTNDATYLIAGASNYNQPTFSDAGAVFIFKKTAGTDRWSQVQRLNPPVPDQKFQLYFGNKLTCSSNADYIFITANKNSGGFADAGTVYPFKKTAGLDTWTQLPEIAPPFTIPFASVFWGNALSVTPDASYLAIGCSNVRFKNNPSGFYRGTAFLYKKDPSTDMWTTIQQLRSSDYTDVQFGQSLAFTRNGEYLAITTLSNAYVFKKQASTDYWLQTAQLSPTASIPFQRFGVSCAISDSARYIVIGASGLTIKGSAFFYQKQATTDQWQLSRSFFPSDTRPSGDAYGDSTAITASGEVIAVGGNNLSPEPQTGNVFGAVIVYQQSTFGSTPVQGTFCLVNTSQPCKTLLLPHPSTIKGQMIYIKDAKSSATYNPIRLSTTNSSYINSTITEFSLFQNNACLQLQSDGLNQYTIVNLFSGVPGAQLNAYNFRSFWVKGSPQGALSNYAISMSFTVPNITSTGVIAQNVFFLDSDNLTRIPHWTQFYTDGINGGSGQALFWLKIPSIPQWPLARQYFMYWNCNYSYEQDPNQIFPFYDDFTGGSNSAPDPSKWFVTKQGSESVSVELTGFNDSINLFGLSNTNANAGILTRNTYLSTNFAMNYSLNTSASTFFTMAFATTSTLQFLPTGGQSNWWTTTLGNGYTLQLSSVANVSFHRQAENTPATFLQATNPVYFGTYCNQEVTFTSNGQIGYYTYSNGSTRTRTTVTTISTATYLTSNKYLFLGQGSITGRDARSTALTQLFLRPFVEPEPFFTGVFDTSNVLV